MALITLTTDFGNKDHFIGSVKGVIYSEIPEVKIVEISNEISPFNIAEGAYIIENAYKIIILVFQRFGFLSQQSQLSLYYLFTTLHTPV